jgi:hypothetical protein
MKSAYVQILILSLLFFSVASCIVDDDVGYNVNNGDFSSDEDDVTGVEVEFPWTDPDTGLMWSERYSTNIGGVSSLCMRKKDGDFDDWRAPTIDELRTLIINCPDTSAGGKCEISEECRLERCFSDSCHGCENTGDGRYSKIGDKIWLGSKTRERHNVCWFIGFTAAHIGKTNDTSPIFVRCVRN